MSRTSCFLRGGDPGAGRRAGARAQTAGRDRAARSRGWRAGRCASPSAEIVPAQARWSPEPGAAPIVVKTPFCRVQGVIETEIGFELWLPARAAWNGKFLGTGVGGDAGAFNFRDLPRGRGARLRLGHDR